MVFAQPESSGEECVQFRTNRGNQVPFLGEAKDAGRPEDIHREVGRDTNSIAVVKQERLGRELPSKHQGFTLSSIESGRNECFNLRNILHGAVRASIFPELRLLHALLDIASLR